VDVVCGFIDSTLQQTARPVWNQRILYNGWKRKHCWKYHCVLAPDGIVMHVFGPVEGRRHDQTVYRESGLAEILEAHFWKPGHEDHQDEHQQLFIYGDAGYTDGPHLLSPNRGSAITTEQSLFNFRMSQVRESVKWLFKEVTQQFPFLDFTRNPKVLKTPCGLFYLIAILLCNAHTIVHSLQIPQYFCSSPPTLEEYFQHGPIEDERLEAWCLDAPWAEVEMPADLDDNV
jgi:hypothetical protein